MDKVHFDEMVKCIDSLISKGVFEGKYVYIFAHCEASLTLTDELMARGITPAMIFGISSRDMAARSFWEWMPIGLKNIPIPVMMSLLPL